MGSCGVKAETMTEKKVEVSTEKYPKRFFVGASPGASFFSRLMATLASL